MSFGVGDTGPGIPSNEQEHLSECFLRGHIGRQSGTPGTGAGLTLAREIVDRHNGKIEIHSQGIPGEGITFRVWLVATAE